VKLEIIVPQGTFEVQQEGPRSCRGSKLRATIGKIEPAGDNNHALYFDPLRSKLAFDNAPLMEELPVNNAPLTEELPVNPDTILQLDSDGIGGLSEQIDVINGNLDDLTFTDAALLDSYLSGPETFLIYGQEGCGKTLLLDRLAKCPWQSVLRLDNDWLASNRKGQSESMSKEIFEKAREQQPSLILIDDLDGFLQKGEDLLSRLRQELQNLEGAQIVVAATARNIYDIDASLRTPSVFKTELELSPPNVRQREEMLRQIIGPNRKATDVDFTSLAERSHGFVGRDIHKLCSLARKHERQKLIRDLRAKRIPCSSEHLAELDFVTKEAFEAVFDQVQPTVLKDSILEVPKVRWADIAGVDHVRTLLEDITVRPYKVDFHLAGILRALILIVYSFLIWTLNSAAHSHARVFCCTDHPAVQRRSLHKQSQLNPT
jgi:AAA family ATPase